MRDAAPLVSPRLEFSSGRSRFVRPMEIALVTKP